MNDLSKNLVVRHNDLVMASYEMTVHEQNVLFACISQLDSRPEAKPISDQDVYTITVEQARDLFYDKGDQRNAFRDLEFASRKLFERKVELDLGGNETLLTRFVQSIKFKPDDGCVELRFATEILPYLTQLQDNFTKYRMGQVVQLSSIHARRLFELIVCWAGQQQWQQELEMDEFRKLMNVGGKYKQFGQLKEKVINIAVEQINESSDFHVTVGYRKVRRSFKFIQLQYHRKEKPQAVTVEKAMSIEDIRKQAYKPFKNGLSNAQIRKLAVHMNAFIEVNNHLISDGDRRQASEIFEQWKIKLANAESVNDFMGIRYFLDLPSTAKKPKAKTKEKTQPTPQPTEKTNDAPLSHEERLEAMRKVNKALNFKKGI